MMAQKHLHELLQEEQEPFILENYIADRRCRLQKSSPTIHFLSKQLKPISKNSIFPSNFSKKDCFFTSHDSPDLIKKRNPPFFETKSPNATFLLEAALRIQNQSSAKTKSRNKNSNGETVNGGAEVSVKEISMWDSPVEENSIISEEKSGCEMGFSSSCNEEKSMDMDLGSSCSCRQSEDFEDNLMYNGVLEHNSAAAKHFSQSPFHFVLQTTPSPSRHGREETYELQSLKMLHGEEEQQCSPVSVLDRPFEDDDRHVDDDYDDGNLEYTYAIVQRAKQQFLHKLRRFEKLAELDPMELEKRMLEQDQDDESSSSQSEMNTDGYNLKHVPYCMKRLVSDLVAEEETMSQRDGCVDNQSAEESVRKRLDSWEDVEWNTIDMMVEQDFRRDQLEGWKGNEEQIRETTIEVERAIFGLLMQELGEELVFAPEIEVNG